MSGHHCKTPGCGSVLVVDGNLKNARQVCGCKAAGIVKFKDLNGKIALGRSNIVMYITIQDLTV